MALCEYRCVRCNEHQLAFPGEVIQGNCGKLLRWCHDFEVLPPKVSVVIATAMYMHDFQLDSHSTAYELDRILNIEAREEKEMEVYQNYRRNA